MKKWRTWKNWILFGNTHFDFYRRISIFKINNTLITVTYFFSLSSSTPKTSFALTFVEFFMRSSPKCTCFSSLATDSLLKLFSLAFSLLMLSICSSSLCSPCFVASPLTDSWLPSASYFLTLIFLYFLFFSAYHAKIPLLFCFQKPFRKCSFYFSSDVCGSSNSMNLSESFQFSFFCVLFSSFQIRIPS